MDYSTVTETPGNRVSGEALAMMYTRYAFAAGLCEGKSVLEVGCGGGQGLGILASKAWRVVGGDYTEGLLKTAAKHYQGRVPLVRLDAHCLPFRERTLDVVILYEAIYYLKHPGRFLAESKRVLRHDGVVLICTVNKEWQDFNPSSFSTTYFSERELRDLLEQQGFTAELYGGFSVASETVKDRFLSILKRSAIRFRLIPKTMKRKEVLKRIFLGRLAAIPPEITEGMAELCPPVALSSNHRNGQYKVLYVVARP